MSSPEAKRILRGFRSAAKARGIIATYSRGDDSVSLRAVPGRNQRMIVADYGVMLDERRNRDWLIEAESLKLSGERTLPERGDTIEADGKTYQVVADQGNPHWRYSDPYDQIIRLHSVEVVSAE